MKSCLVFCLLAFATPLSRGEEWTPTVWLGERAYAGTSSGWKAIVSVDRARLVYLGSADGTANLLFSTPTLENPVGWGGHRLWLGPQTNWGGKGWPPPDAWEKSAAATVEIRGNQLRLSLPATGDGWPNAMREYEWKDGSLLCNARTHGGTRPAQIIHILQVPSSARVVLDAVFTPEAPQGYVLLHLGRSPSPQTKFGPRTQIKTQDGKLHISFDGTSEKIGTKPQALVATIGRYQLRVARSDVSGQSAGTPDVGFVTQVYLGRKAEPIIELEQLSDLWAPGVDASFQISVTPTLAGDH
jgi:hypothetical protein